MVCRVRKDCSSGTSQCPDVEEIMHHGPGQRMISTATIFQVFKPHSVGLHPQADFRTDRPPPVPVAGQQPPPPRSDDTRTPPAPGINQ